MDLINPATEEVKQLTETPVEAIKDMVTAARKAQKEWSSRSLEERIAVLQKVASRMAERKQQLAEVITEDMGKPLARSLEEVGGIVEEVRYFCAQAPAWFAPENVEGGQTVFDPLGMVGIISPWNYPLLMPFASLTPALLAGNGVVFKPSEHTLLTGMEIGKLFAGILPEGLLQVVIGGKDHGKELVKQDIDLVSFTGSTLAGKDIMRASSDQLHKVILELGGLDAAIVLKDVDIGEAARKIVKGNARNTGQVCFSIKRVYVEQPVYQEFVEAVVEESKKITAGPPEEDVDMGPLVGKFQLDKVESILEDAKGKGAKVLTGGARKKGKGFFFPSTVLTGVTPDMRILKEEPFGPILPIIPVKDWHEGVRLANATRYGLTGSVWTKDVELGKAIARQLDVGVVGINVHGSGPPGTPWGGAKESGLGRMENKEGFREFTNIKFVRVGR